MKTHHISLLTGDAKLNADYYVGVLGMRFIKNSVNQANPKNRHVYYGDFMGTPGTVITFFPIDDLRDRTDGKMFFSGIHYSIPEGSTQYWLDRFAEKGLKAEADAMGRIRTADYEDLPIRMQETEGKNFDWHINYMSDVPAEFQITGVIGAELHVPDVAATGRFFEDLLEIPVKGNIIDLEGVEAIELVQTAEDAPNSRFGKGSTDHYALGVESEEDLKYFWERAKALGYKREVFIDRGYFIEPGGNRVELATTNPGFTLDESLFDLGTTFALPPRFEASRQELLDHYAKKGVFFDEVKPYTGTGHLENDGKIRAIHDEKGNTRND